MSTPTSVSLREQLGGTPDPDFTLVLPPGWERRPVDAAEERRMLGDLRSRLLQAQRPDLAAQMNRLVGDAFTQMRALSAVAMFVPAGSAEDGTLYLPASLTATVQQAEAGVSLDEVVRAAVREHGATPLFEDKRFLRMERDEVQTIEGERAAVTTVLYLTPIPGSRRRRALRLTLVIMRPEDAPADDEPVVAMKALFDLCVSTLAWIPAGTAA
ncbi:MAG: protein TPRXL [Actinobacteria bacterium]|nr:protein TPRXL [Actinomycetota bacterium]